jgi:hypothetical protein
VNTMFGAVDGILERMNEKLTELESSDQQIVFVQMLEVLEIQVSQLV